MTQFSWKKKQAEQIKNLDMLIKKHEKTGNGINAMLCKKMLKKLKRRIEIQDTMQPRKVRAEVEKIG